MHEGKNVEVAHELSKGDVARDERRSRGRIEIFDVSLLAIVAVVTAWSGYQAAKWDGHQALEYGIATTLRVESNEASTIGGQQRLLDISTFNTWIQAYQQGDVQLAQLYVRRFSPEYRIAFNAWLETRPFSNPHAPPGPIFMPEYHNAQSERAAKLEREAVRTFDAGTAARETADRYVRQTVLLAMVLFLVAVGQRFTIRGPRIAVAVLAIAVTLFAVAGVVSLPRI